MLLHSKPVGLKPQRRRREFIRILKDVEVREGSKFIGLYPGAGYGIDYAIDFPNADRKGQVLWGSSMEDYYELIAPARTFGFQRR